MTSRTDFIMRAVEQVARGIMSARKRRRQGDEQEAIEELTQACESLTGLSTKALLAMPLSSMMLLLSAGATVDVAKALMLTELLLEEGICHETAGHIAHAMAAYRRSFCVFDEVVKIAPNAPELKHLNFDLEFLLTKSTEILMKPGVQATPSAT